MAQSENIGNLALALSRLQAEMEAVEKTADNDGVKKNNKPVKYADLAAMVIAAKPFLGKLELAVTHTPGVRLLGTEIVDTLETTLMHSSGEWKSGEQRLFLTRKASGGGLYDSHDSQTMGSATSYARRYGFCSILNLITDDDDGQQATTEQRKHVTEGPEPVARKEYPKEEPKQEKEPDRPVPTEEWTALMATAEENKWPLDLVKLSIENENKRGRHKTQRSLFNWAKIKYGKLNESAEPPRKAKEPAEADS